MLYNMQSILITLFIFSSSVYAMIVLREKRAISSMTLVIDNQTVPEEIVSESDKFFLEIDGKLVLSGDEIKITTKQEKKFLGTLVGVKDDGEEIIMITKKKDLIYLKRKNISSIKVLSRYGKFINWNLK